ncbi:MAG: hypothetical protein KIS96_12680 [Bauldia sp.]|nr:hypothetical protein [Bauldia sp.]
MTWNRLALAGAFMAAFTLAACGDDDDPPAVAEPDQPAMEAEAPAMEAEAPAMEAEAPANEIAGDPPVGPTVPITLGQLVGNWAPDTASCEANNNVVEIGETRLNTPEDDCAFTGEEAADGSVVLQLTCVGGETETWTVMAEGTTDAIAITDGADSAASLVRCTNG